MAPKCKFCKRQMSLTIEEDKDYENPFGGGSVYYHCSCGAKSPSETFGFGQGSQQNAVRRLKSNFGS